MIQRFSKMNNPRFLEDGRIEIEALLDGEQVFFIADQNDYTEHGRIIYEDAIDGYFGPIAPYVPPTADEIRAELAAQVLAERDRRLETDVDKINAVRWNSMTTEEQDEWRKYRKALLDIPQQKDFPENVVWPIVPTL